MIANHDDLFRTHDDWDQTLRFGGLRRLIDEHHAEAEVCESRITGTDCCGANDIRVLEDFALKFLLSVAILLLVSSAQFAELVLQLLQLLKRFVRGPTPT